MRRARYRVVLMILTVVGCTPRSESSDEGLGEVGGMDTRMEGLTAFVRNGDYASWHAEPAVHDTSAPHKKKVRVFFNDALVASLQAQNDVHPVGAATVKEMYAADGTTLQGHAVQLKVAEGAGKDTWLFYEGFTPDYADPFYGRGHPTCEGCHAAGADFVRSPLP